MWKPLAACSSSFLKRAYGSFRPFVPRFTCAGDVLLHLDAFPLLVPPFVPLWLTIPRLWAVAMGSESRYTAWISLRVSHGDRRAFVLDVTLSPFARLEPRSGVRDGTNQGFRRVMEPFGGPKQSGMVPSANDFGALQAVFMHSAPVPASWVPPRGGAQGHTAPNPPFLPLARGRCSPSDFFAMPHPGFSPSPLRRGREAKMQGVGATMAHGVSIVTRVREGRSEERRKVEHRPGALHPFRSHGMPQASPPATRVSARACKVEAKAREKHHDAWCEGGA